MCGFMTHSCLSTVCAQELLNPPLECQGKNERGKLHTPVILLAHVMPHLS